MNSVENLNQRIIHCQACSRLRTHCATIAAEKRKMYENEAYWGKPVPGFGASCARLWIVGLAPGAHGANRTGRVFTGDKSGEWLFSALHRFGLSSAPESRSPEDGLQLKDTYISCVCKCAPPDNRPTSDELKSCNPYLISEWRLLNHPPIILTLGRVAFETILKLLLDHYQLTRNPEWKFKHSARYKIGDTELFASYHPSQQNTFTGKLTLSMWNQVFKKVRRSLESHPFAKD